MQKLMGNYDKRALQIQVNGESQEVLESKMPKDVLLALGAFDTLRQGVKMAEK